MKTFLNICKKAITYVLVAAIVVCAFPICAFATELQSFFEAEDIQPADDATVVWTVKEDSLASNGKVVSGTKGAAFILTNVAESNQIIMMASGTESGVATVSIRENDQWRELGSMSFATTQDTAIKYGNEVQLSGIYIPQGAEIMVAPQVDMTIDYFRFTADPLNNESELKSHQLLAKNGTLSGSAIDVDNIMSTVGRAVNLSAEGDSVTLTVPESIESGKYNSFNIKYYADADAVVSLSVDETELKDMTLFACSYGQFSSRGNNRAADIKGGSTITVTLKSGNVTLDMLTLFELLIADKATEIALPESSDGRSVTSLDGVWYATKTAGVTPSATIPVPDGDYYYTAAVPGFWDMATPDMGDYTKQNLWYKKTIVLPDDYAADSGYTVQLEILKAQYGRSIYINGKYIEHYTWNYSASYTDITKYLNPGENTVEIMLGYYGSFFDSSIKPAAATDPERTVYQPGIPDSVSVIVNRTPQVYSVQTSADLDKGTVQVRAKLSNKSSLSVTTGLTVNVYELGIVKNGVASRRVKVGSYSVSGIKVSAKSTKQIDIDAILLSGFDKSTKAWCPDNPYLYEIEVKTAGDTLSERFGMRTFTFDPETKQPMLNGEIYRLLGTNVVINRFYEDPARGDYPWNEQWVRDLYATFRDTNWEVIRTHVGPFPDFWYDIADETGMMLIDEYAIFTDWWFTYKSTLPEMRAIIDQRQTHPSIIYWDIQNEKAEQTRTTEVVTTLMDEGYDISNRCIDNGMALPYDENQPVEFHPYHFWGVKTMDEFVKFNTLSNTVPIGGGDNTGDIVNPKIINEYAEMWLDRWGDPTSISADNYAGFMPDATREERLQFYAEFIAKCTEFWRAGRNIAGIQYFSGLTYSKPNAGGATGDLLLPDISTPQVRPETQEVVKDSFERLGIVIERYDVYTAPGMDFTFPVTLINDLNRPVDDLPVTFKVTCNGRVLAEQKEIYNMAAVGDADGKDLVTKNFEFVTPVNLSNGDELLVTATYTLDGKEVSSLRRMICRGFKDKSQNNAVDTLCSAGKNVEASSVADGTAQNAVNGLLDTYTMGDRINITAGILCGNANNGKKASVSVGAVKIEVSCSSGYADPACTVYVNGTSVGSMALTATSPWFLGKGCNINATIDTSAKTVDISLLNLRDNTSYSGTFEFTDDISFENAVATASVTGNHMSNCWKVTNLEVSNADSETSVQIIPAANTAVWTGNSEQFDDTGVYAAAVSGTTYTASVNIDDCCGYWQSDANEDAHITVDLGATAKLNRVKLYWGENYGVEYKIQVSTDGETYTDAVHVTDGAGGTATHRLPDGTIARYVRLQGVASSSSGGYSLYEFEVYKKNNNAVVYSTGKPATASSYEASWAVPSRATDGVTDNTDNRWSANASHEEWLTVDLGIVKEIFKVDLMWSISSYGKEYKIQVSDDGETFTDVLHVTDGKGETATFDMPAGTYGRYVRMQGIQYGGYGYSMKEFVIYCEQAEGLLYSTGKTATASSYEDWWAVPGKVTDGVCDNDHRWSANASTDDWITVDLGVVKELTKAELVWTKSAYAKEFLIQVSDDGETFTDVLHIVGGGGGAATYELPSGTSGRYVRMQGIAYGYLSSYSLQEFNIYIAIPKEEPSALESIRLDKEQMVLGVNAGIGVGRAQLLAFTQPLDANDISELKWSSDAPEVATVDSEGKVTAVSNGVANITYTVVTNEDVTYTAACAVTVTGIYDVTFEQTAGCTIQSVDGEATVKEGGNYSFTVTVKEGYVKGDGFAVYANGVELTEVDGVYTVSNVVENQIITVTGVTAEETEILLGDVNRDGAVDSADVLAVEQMLLGILKADGNTVAAADLNGNLVIDPSDLHTLKLQVIGLA